jgi:hypothetical protein
MFAIFFHRIIHGITQRLSGPAFLVVIFLFSFSVGVHGQKKTTAGKADQKA